LWLLAAACNRSEAPASGEQATANKQELGPQEKPVVMAKQAAEKPSVAEKVTPPAQNAPPAEGEAAAEAKAEDTSEAVAQEKAAKAAPVYSEAMLNPDKANLKAPDKFTVRLKTTKGDVIIDVTREWAPLAADHFYNLVKMGFFTDVAFFRVIAGFMAQVGVHGDPKINEIWGKRSIKDEEPKQSNTQGMVTFAAAGKDSRATQFFINFSDNSRLDHYPPSGFTPFGKVRKMTALDRIYTGYGEGAPMGRGPNQVRLNKEGNAYLEAEFPQLDYIREAVIE